MTKPPTLSELLSAVRDVEGLSYAEMGARCGLSKPRVYQLTTGQHGSQNPTHETLLRLSHGLGIPMSDLMAATSTAGADTRRQQLVGQVLAHAEAMDDATLELAEAVLAVIVAKGRQG